jgi:hypothetical protein
MRNLPIRTRSRKIQKQHTRRYDSGKVSVVNRGISKPSTNLSTNLRSRISKQSVGLQPRKNITTSSSSLVEKLQPKLSPRVRPKTYAQDYVFELWDSDSMDETIEDYLEDSVEFPQLQIRINKNDDQWNVSLNLDFYKGPSMAQITIKGNDLVKIGDLFRKQFRKILKNSKGRFDGFVVLENYPNNSGVNVKQSSFINNNYNILDEFTSKTGLFPYLSDFKGDKDQDSNNSPIEPGNSLVLELDPRNLEEFFDE